MKMQLIGGLAAATLLFTACGDDSSETEPAATTTVAPAPSDVAAEPDTDVPAAAVQAAVAATSLGDALVDADGLTLYGFTNDVDGVPACYDACAGAWPPVLVDGEISLGADLDASVFSTVERTDGTTQLVAGKWPLYLFAGDGAPGDVNGQGSGDVWFVAAPDGSLIKDDDAADEAAAAASFDY